MIAARAAEILADSACSYRPSESPRPFGGSNSSVAAQESTFPFASGCEGVKILVRTRAKGLRRCTNDADKIKKSLFIYLISMQQIDVIAKVSKKPIEFPERSLCAIQPASKRPIG